MRNPMKIMFVYLVSVTLLLRCSEAQIAKLNHLQLVNAWSQTFCQDARCKESVIENFYLHGLWPADENGKTISGCPDKYNDKQVTAAIKNNKAQLETYWPSIIEGSTGESFWKNEWTQHGPCTDLKPEDYYRIATATQEKINHQSKANLLGALHRANLRPSNTRSYPKANIVAAIKTITNNNNVYVSCNTESYLKEIFICLDKTGKNYISCPETGDARGCADNIIIPTGLNHLQLVNTWSPTFCRDTPCKSRITNNFYLHGLWPADSNGRTISGCPDTATGNELRAAIQANRAQLDGYWPSIIKAETGETFWMHEWTRHGPCTNLAPTDYYRIATAAQKGINLLGALRSANIIVSNTRSYSKANIVAAIKTITNNNNVYISCKRKSSTESYLKEIFICLDTAGSNYIPCPGTGGARGCATNIFIPTSITLGTDDVAVI